MITSVWSKDAAIKQAVIDAYKTIFIDRPAQEAVAGAPRKEQKQRKAMAVAKSLSKLTVGATLGELASLEELVMQLVEDRQIDQLTLAALWALFDGSSAARPAPFASRPVRRTLNATGQSRVTLSLR